MHIKPFSFCFFWKWFCRFPQPSWLLAFKPLSLTHLSPWYLIRAVLSTLLGWDTLGQSLLFLLLLSPCILCREFSQWPTSCSVSLVRHLRCCSLLPIFLFPLLPCCSRSPLPPRTPPIMLRVSYGQVLCVCQACLFPGCSLTVPGLCVGVLADELGLVLQYPNTAHAWHSQSRAWDGPLLCAPTWSSFCCEEFCQLS